MRVKGIFILLLPLGNRSLKEILFGRIMDENAWTMDENKNPAEFFTSAKVGSDGNCYALKEFGNQMK